MGHWHAGLRLAFAGGVALGAQYRQTLVVAALDIGPDHVDPFAGVGAVGFGQGPQGLARQGDR